VLKGSPTIAQVLIINPRFKLTLHSAQVGGEVGIFRLIDCTSEKCDTLRSSAIATLLFGFPTGGVFERGVSILALSAWKTPFEWVISLSGSEKEEGIIVLRQDEDAGALLH
jgi:hypothetical protein